MTMLVDFYVLIKSTLWTQNTEWIFITNIIQYSDGDSAASMEWPGKYPVINQ